MNDRAKLSMDQQRQLAPGVASSDRVVLFDGVCRLCAAWARFLIRFDKQRQFKLATVQSSEGQAILQWYGLPRDHFETMLLIDGPRAYTKSSAFFEVMRRLPWPWRAAYVGMVVPVTIRDWLYDRVALNRYTLFGRYQSCMLPSPDHDSRFLGGGDGV